MKTSVVIPNWNGRQLLEKNLPHVLDMNVDEVVVVDDGSTDGSIVFIKTLQENEPRLKVLRSEKNNGFARAANQGVAHANGDIIILLNTDVKPSLGLASAVFPHFKHKEVFGVSFSEEQWSWSKGVWRDGFFEHEPGEKSALAHPTFWISGGSCAFRKTIWDKLGGFDTMYAPFYWEDIDLSYRAVKRGYKLVWEPRARVEHQHEGTIGKYFTRDYINFIQERNQLLFIWKNITDKEMFKEHLMGFVKRIIHSPGYIKVVLAAFSKISQVIGARNVEKSEANVNDRHIFAQFT